MADSTIPATDTTPCKDCESPVDSDVSEEELGFCISCSDDYWGHRGRYAD
jgi:hypothetical protein